MQTPIVIVVGSTGGIGSATAREFAARGHLVVGIDAVSIEHGIAHHLLNGPHPAKRDFPNLYHHVQVALPDPDGLNKALRLADSLGEVRHVIIVAGGADATEIAAGDDLVLVSTETFIETVQLNLVSSFEVAKAVLPRLRAVNGDTSITFTSSINAVEGIGAAGYSAAKAGLISLARTIAVNEGCNNIRCNTVTPGTVVTPRTQYLYENNPDQFNSLTATTSLGRTATTGEIAKLYVALALDLTAVTGQSIIADCGQSARWR